jgi:hypothetical protein
MTLKHVLATLALVGFCAPRLRGQGAAVRSHRDYSTVAQAVTGAIITELTPELDELVRAPTNWRWQFTVPEEPAWSGTAAGLQRLLQARVAHLRDSVQYYLRIVQRVRGDTTIRYAVEIGRRWRCPDGQPSWIESTRHFDVLAVRDAARVWRASRVGLVLIGDPAVCVRGTSRDVR